jgi:hypothetical protein
MINYKKYYFIFNIIISLLIHIIYSYDDFYEIDDCTPKTCLYPSLCITNKICKCKKGFYNTNTESNGDFEKKCNYEMKSSYSPFWVEIITNLGIGHMIIGNYYFGLLKLFYIIFTFGFFYYVCMSDANSKKNLGDCFHVFLSILNFIFCLGLFAWWVFDGIFFGLNKYKDNNGVELLER